MGDMSKISEAAPATPAAVRIPVEAYISEAYARAERDKLWRKVWLQAGRVDDLPHVGSYVTYDILDDSVLIVRTATDRIKAYHNVCTHRGRKLIDTPAGQRNARGQKMAFVCGAIRSQRADSGSRCDSFGNSDECKYVSQGLSYAEARP